MNSTTESMALHLPGYQFSDLFLPERLAALYGLFQEKLQKEDSALHGKYLQFLRNPVGHPDDSDIMTAVAPHLSRFIGSLFGIPGKQAEIRDRYQKIQKIFQFKKEFVGKRLKGRKGTHFPALANADLKNWVTALSTPLNIAPSGDLEADTASIVMHLVESGAQKTEFPTPLASVASVLLKKSGIADSPSFDLILRCLEDLVAEVERQGIEWVSFKKAAPLEFQNLVEKVAVPGAPENHSHGPSQHYRHRDGFKLTDPRFDLKQAMGEVNYCLICHPRHKDSCSTGIKEKEGGLRKNPLGVPLTGCPLEEKISEAHQLFGVGDPVGALAIIMIDNPMVAGTGHRICNDCMKACIFQKQEPVNIPQVETRILTDVLHLPFGFEIYGLLSRWNPLNKKRPHLLPYNGVDILVVGLGPAGYTLAHYLLNEGFGVVGVDGLKIEPLDEKWVGSEKRPPEPVRDINLLQKPLDERILMGFGGVSEYGITVRWDKNFLSIIYLTLSRQKRSRFYGGVRFGGTLTIDDAWKYGFRHIAMATGAGKPTIVPMKNNLIRGIRMASDFLMALQLTGAAKKSSLANLQVQLPAVVIGGGLTAVDTATELFAYYPIQVEKVFLRTEELKRRGEWGAVEKNLSPEDIKILTTFLLHGEAVVRERQNAKAEGREVNFIPLVRSFGGVKLIYRTSMQDSPSYRLNHEEIIKGFEEGMEFVEGMNPKEAIRDEFGAIKELVFEKATKDAAGKWINTGTMVNYPAKSVFIAAGTSPNIIYEKESPGTFKLDEWKEFFLAHQRDPGNGNLVPAKGKGAIFTSYQAHDRYISIYGDNHPNYAGNVVKAMASARAGYSEVTALFANDIQGQDKAGQQARDAKFLNLAKTLDEDLTARVERVNRLTPTILEVVVKAPQAARNFQPGQFYRLQNFESTAPLLRGTRLNMEGTALTGAWVDKARGLLSVIVLEMGVSSLIIGYLKPGERVILMGPTGAPTHISEKPETVILFGGGLGNAVLFSIARAFKERGCTILYFAGYKQTSDFFKREEIEAATDCVIYSVDAGEKIPAHRPGDFSFRGNIIQAALAYQQGELGPIKIPLSAGDRIIAIGSDRMMEAVKNARHGVLKPYLKPGHLGIGSINSTMQCMMKEVCAQCLQKHVDPATGKEVGFVFTCFNQDQELDRVDFPNLNERLRANSLSEKISLGWFKSLIAEHQVAPMAMG